MEPRAHHVLIGSFTVVVVGCALLFGLWLAKAGSDADTELYDVVFEEAVSGLSIGSDVRYSGIQVGEVERLALDPDDPRRVVARVRIDAGIPVDAGTRARLTIPNITGSTTIQLSSGPPDSPPLEAPRNGVPVIVAEPSSIAALQGNSEALLSGISALVDNANQLMSRDNAERVSRTLEHLAQASAVIADQREDIRRGVQGLGEASQHASETLREASRLLNRLNTLLERDGERVMSSASESMAALERATGTVERLLTENEDAMSSGMRSMNELGPALHELRTTLSTLGDIARRLEQDPARYLLGGDGVREFQP